MDCSTLGFAVLHYLAKFAQTHDHGVGDAIQPSHPPSSFSSCVQSLSCVQLFATPWTAAPQAPFNISQSLLKFMSVELVRLSHHLILCCPLLLLPSVFPNIRVFSNESALHIRWPKCWHSSFSISSSNEYSELISPRMD